MVVARALANLYDNPASNIESINAMKEAVRNPHGGKLNAVISSAYIEADISMVEHVMQISFKRSSADDAII